MTTITNTRKNIIGNTKKQIIEVSRQLFSKYSYLGVSMADIAKNLNITKAALYYHFTGKIEIYKNVLDEVFSGLNKYISRTFKEKTERAKLQSFIENYLDFGFEEKNFIKAMMFKLPFTDSKVKNYISEFKEKNINLISPLVRVMAKNKKTDSKLISFLLIEMMNGLILEHNCTDKNFDSKKLTKQIISTLF